MKNAINTMVQAVRFLERKYETHLWVLKSHLRVRALEIPGDSEGRKGLCDRPVLPFPWETYELICKLFRFRG